MEIRELQVKDVFAVARMLGKITKGARLQLAAILTGKKKADPTEVGMVIFQSLVTEAEEDMKTWLADLIGKELADFEVMPATTILDIIEKLLEQEGIKGFLSQASQLAGKITAKD